MLVENIFLKNIVLMLSLLVLGHLVLTEISEFSRDATDGDAGRSGLDIHTDCATGLQYLSGDGGGLTPRLAMDGTHMHVPCRVSQR